MAAADHFETKQRQQHISRMRVSKSLAKQNSPMQSIKKGKELGAEEKWVVIHFE